MAQNCPKKAQEGTKRVPRGHRKAKIIEKTYSFCMISMIRQHSAQEGSGGTQDGTKTAREGFKIAQDAPEMAPRRPKTAQERLKRASRRL